MSKFRFPRTDRGLELRNFVWPAHYPGHFSPSRCSHRCSYGYLRPETMVPQHTTSSPRCPELRMSLNMVKNSTTGRNAVIDDNIMARSRTVCAIRPVSSPRHVCRSEPGFPDMSGHASSAQGYASGPVSYIYAWATELEFCNSSV